MRFAAAMRMNEKFAAKATSFSVRSRIQRARASSRYVESVAAIRPSRGVSVLMNGTSTLDSAITTTGAPATMSSRTAPSSTAEPHESTSTTSVSATRCDGRSREPFHAHERRCGLRDEGVAHARHDRWRGGLIDVHRDAHGRIRLLLGARAHFQHATEGFCG